MTQSMILVTGATGKTGSRICAQLELLGAPVRRASRTIKTPFDWQNRATWQAALTGISSVYICYYPDFAFPGALETLAQFISTAKNLGVTRFVMVTGRGESHAKLAEEILLSSASEATILRSAWFAQNFSEGSLLEPILEGVLPMPGEDPGEPIVDLDDFAEAAAWVLTRPGHDGKVYDITGPEVITFAQMAAVLSQITCRNIQYSAISFEDFHQALAATTDNQYADIVTSIALETFDGRNACIGDGIQQILKRRPKTFTQFAQDAYASDVWPFAS